MDKVKQTISFNVNINWIFLILFTFYQFTAIFEGYDIVGYIIYYMIPLLVIIINYKYCFHLMRIFLQRENRGIVICLCLFFIITAVWPVVMGTQDFTALTNEPLNLIKRMVIQLFLIIVYCKYFKRNINLEEYMHYYILSCVLYVMGTILMLVFPGIKTFFYEHIKDNEHARQVALQANYITRYGWSGFSNFEHTMKCSISVGFIGYLITKKEYLKKIIYYILLVFCLLGNMFYGRIGIVASGLIILLIFAYLIKEDKKYAVYLGAGFVILAIGIGVLSFFNDSAKLWLNWIFSNFINMFNGGDLLSGSLGIVFNDMIFMPSVKTILIGDGMYTDLLGGYYMNTDVGFMRTVLFAGIPYVIVRYSLFYYVVKMIKKYIPEPQKMNLIMIVAFVIGEIKGEILITFLTILIPIIILSISKERIEVNDKKKC